MFHIIHHMMFIIIPIIIISVFVITLIKAIRQWMYNNAQPVLTVEAKVISKRMNVSRRNNSTNDNFHSSSSTTYYITFEANNGDRMEFCVSGQKYGLIVENDIGKLTFQGTRYMGFDRQR